jgi:Fur family ferric uptake transcriptional regulator
VTVAYPGPAVVVDDVAAAVEVMRSRGLRASASRRVVLTVLFAAPGPVPAEQIADGLGGRFPQSDLGSVYRNLDTLERVGLVRHLHLGHGPGLYTVAAPQGQEYLVCEHCHGVRAVAPAELDEVRRLLRRDFGFTAGFGHFPIVGRCADCGDAGSPAGHDHDHGASV